MKTLLKVMVIMLVGLCFAPEVPAQGGRTVYVVCRKFVAEKNCHKCSDYFHARSEDEAKAKCGKKGYSEANYFGSFGSMTRWMLPNCSCDND